MYNFLITHFMVYYTAGQIKKKNIFYKAYINEVFVLVINFLNLEVEVLNQVSSLQT